MRLIDADALHTKILEENRRNYAATENVAQILLRIETAPTIEADIDRAEILRLCNEIKDIVSEISKLSENYLIYSDCKSILDRTKAIRKELAEDAGSKTD